jgi:hypothetical protein
MSGLGFSSDGDTGEKNSPPSHHSTTSLHSVPSLEDDFLPESPAEITPSPASAHSTGKPQSSVHSGTKSKLSQSESAKLSLSKPASASKEVATVEHSVDGPEVQLPARQKRKPWYENEPLPPQKTDQSAEIERLRTMSREQRSVIENQKQTIKLLLNEAVAHEEISSLRAALASKSPILQVVAATPMSEQPSTKQLRNENRALRKQIDDIEIRHLNELKAMKAQFAALAAKPVEGDGCVRCKRRIEELEEENKRIRAEIEKLKAGDQ